MDCFNNVQKQLSIRDKSRRMAYLLGTLLGILMIVYVTLPEGQGFLAIGPMNTGHESLTCIDCHKEAPGTLRQQIQARVRYWLGFREDSVTVGRQHVTNEICLGCHERPKDRHPIYRFLEPRFETIRKKIQPHQCTSCHQEHQGERVTQTRIGFCVACHEKTRLKKDPLTTPHHDLITLKLWNSCLGCHDFHGNHKMKTAQTLDKIIPKEIIEDYFQGGASPYGEVYHKAKHESK